MLVPVRLCEAAVDESLEAMRHKLDSQRVPSLVKAMRSLRNDHKKPRSCEQSHALS